LKSFVDTNLNPEQVTSVSAAYHKLHEAFSSFATTLSDAVKKSKGEKEPPPTRRRIISRA
jgi:hypothetical protein